MEIEAVTSDSIQVVSFSLVNESNKKKENYAVPIDQVREIRLVENITKVPKAKSYVKGVMNLRGLIIPVIDIKKKLGFGETNDLGKTKYQILIADVRDSIYGLIVDNVEQVMQIYPKDIEPVPPDTFESHHYIKGIAKINKKLIVLLDIIALLEDSEESTKELTNVQPTKQLDLSIHNSNSINEKDAATTDDNKEDKIIEDDIPDELKEVFKEDEEGITPAEISR